MPQVTTPEIRISQVGITKNESAQIGFSKVRPSKIAATEVHDIAAFDALSEHFEISDSKMLERLIL
mgnify:CR=1 FL=1